MKRKGCKKTRRDRSGRVILAMILGVQALSMSPASAVSATELEQAKREKQALQRELDRKVAAYQKATAGLEATEEKARKAKRRLGESMARLKSSQDNLNLRANSMYRRGNVSFFQVLLETKSLSEFERKMTLLEASALRDSSDMIRAARARADVDEEQANLKAARDQQKKLVA